MLSNRKSRPAGLDQSPRMSVSKDNAPVLGGQDREGPRRAPDVTLRAALRKLVRSQAAPVPRIATPVEPLTPKVPESISDAAPEPTVDLGLGAGPEVQPVAEVENEEDGLHFGMSPVDLPAVSDNDNDADGLRWTLAVIALSSALLILFNSFAIDKWARQLETTSTTGPIKDAAARWHATMQGLHLDAPLEGGRWLWREAKAARWSEEQEEDDPRR